MNVTALLSSLLLTILWPITVSAEKTVQILIVANTDDAPYQQTINGFKGQLISQLNVTYSELFLSQIENMPATLAAVIQDHKPELIFALGGESTRLASQNTSNIPIVSTMVMKNDLFEQANNITGVSLRYPLTTQFQWIKKFFPEKREIAILYNPEENEQTAKYAQEFAPQVGLNLIAIPVRTPRQLSFALERLAKDIQILLAIPDEIAMSSRTAQAVLLASFRNKVPLIGLSDNWVKSGALYALSWDYDDLGQQCALQSEKLLNGVSIQHIPMEYPRKVSYTINVKIAEHMKVSITDNLRKNAKLIFD